MHQSGTRLSSPVHPKHRWASLPEVWIALAVGAVLFVECVAWLAAPVHPGTAWLAGDGVETMSFRRGERIDELDSWRQIPRSLTTALYDHRDQRCVTGLRYLWARFTHLDFKPIYSLRVETAKGQGAVRGSSDYMQIVVPTGDGATEVFMCPSTSAASHAGY